MADGEDARSSTAGTENIIRGRGTPLATLGQLALMLLAFAVRVQDLTMQDIWWDEARNFDVALRPFTQIATASELDIHPPLYFWGLHVWLMLSGAESVSALELAYLGRFFSVGAGLIGVALLAVWARTLAGPSAVFLVLLISGLSPFWVAESQETRMYTLGLALAAGAGWYLWRGVQRAEQEPAGWRTSIAVYAPYVGLAAAALLVHYNMAFVLAAWHLWWLGEAVVGARGNGRFLRRLWPNLLAGLAVLFVCLPILPIALRQIPTYANPNLIVPSVGEYLLENWRAYLGGYAVDSEWLASWMGGWLVVMAALLLLGLAFVGVRRTGAPHSAKSAGVSFLLVWLAGGLALYYIAVWDRGAFNVRYASFVTPALYLLLAIAIDALAQGRLVRQLLLMVLVGGGLALATVADLRDPVFFREDVRGLVSWLEAESEGDDVILVDQRYPFGFYWPGFADHPEDEPMNRAGAQARYLFVDINTLDARLNDTLAGANRVFWVQWFESDTDPRRAVHFLLDGVAPRVVSRDFRGFSVTAWDLPADVRFELAPNWEPLGVGFEAAATLHAVSVPDAVEGGKVPVALRWGPFVPHDNRRWKARVALYNAEGARLTQIDARLLNDRHLFPGEWQAEDRPINVYLLQSDTPLPPGLYEVRVLVYDEDSPEHVTWVHVDDPAEAVDQVELRLGQVRVR